MRSFHYRQARQQSPPYQSPIFVALAGLLFSPEIAFGDAYTDGRIVVDGDLVQLMEHVIRLMRVTKSEGWCRRVSSRWLQRLQANTIAGSARNIHHHFDLTTDFYRLWLDSRLVYTCGYSPSPSATLEQAQIAKNGLRLPQAAAPAG